MTASPRARGFAASRRTLSGALTVVVAATLVACTADAEPAAVQSPTATPSTASSAHTTVSAQSTGPIAASSQSNSSIPTRTLPSPPTTPIAAPTKGNIRHAVPAAKPAAVRSATLTAPVTPEHGVTVTVTDISAVNAVARFPGEIAGPGIAVTISITNTSSAALDLDNVIVDVRGSDGTRAVSISGNPADPMSGTLGAGDAASGVYVFTIPRDRRQPVSIRVSYTTDAPTVLFVGDIRP